MGLTLSLQVHTALLLSSDNRSRTCRLGLGMQLTRIFRRCSRTSTSTSPEPSKRRKFQGSLCPRRKFPVACTEPRVREWLSFGSVRSSPRIGSLADALVDFFEISHCYAIRRHHVDRLSEWPQE